MLRTVMGYLAAADHTAMAAEAQAECLLALEEMDAVKTAIRAKMLGAFTAAQGYSADADYSPRSWLIHRTRITRGAAAGYLAWAHRAAAHPHVVQALAERNVSESYARKICEWSDKLPADCRDAADAILIVAAKAGAHLEDLVQLAAEMYTRSLPESDEDRDRLDEAFEDRSVRVETTFDGAGVIHGDLTPECAAVVTAVLESLSAPMGAEDTRTREQRYHDALQEAMRRLIASGMLPERAGQPVKVWGHISMAELRDLDDGSVLQGQWIAEMAARWAARRAAASEGGGGDGWTAKPPEPWPATRSSPRSSPARWIQACWMTWCGCAWNWTAWTMPPTAPARPTAAGRTPGRRPRRPVRRCRRRSSAKPRYFYCTLGRRLTCGYIHDEGIASLRPAKAERRTGVVSFGARLSLPLAAFSEATSAPPRACGGRWGAGRSRRTASGSPPAAATASKRRPPLRSSQPAAPFWRIPAAPLLHVTRLDPAGPGPGVLTDPWRSCGLIS